MTVRVVWGYEAPLSEVREIAGRLCFYNEKVDLIVDGEHGPGSVATDR